MINLKVNKVKNFLPLSISKGSFEQRLQKARHMNLAFYDNLQGSIRNNGIAPKSFVNVLKDTLGTKKIGVSLVNKEDVSGDSIQYCFDKNAISVGYILPLIFMNYENKIHKNSAPQFLNQTQDFFNEIFNPKVMMRFVSLFNQGEDLKSILDFYKQKLSRSTQDFDRDAFDKFLEEKSNKVKINTLQLFRYKLLQEKNTEVAKAQIDRRIERYQGFKYVRPEGYYDTSKFKYDEKLGYIGEKLLQAFQQERK